MVNINSAESNRASLRIVKEITWATTPTAGSPITRDVRFTSSSLVTSKDTVLSEEIRADRMVDAIIEVAASSGGDVNFEFSSGGQDAFFEAFLLGDWTRDIYFDRWVGTGVAFGTTSRIDITGDFVNYFSASMRLKTEGFLDPANNQYWSVASVALVSGVTQVTLNETTAVVETASAFTTVMDANDVIILLNTTVRAGTASAKTFDTNGGNGFAAAIAASPSQLVPGQKIWVQGLAAELGQLDIDAQPTDGETFTLDDGVNTPIVYEFDTGGAVTSGNISVTVGGTEDATATNMQAAVMGQYAAGNSEISSVLDLTGVGAPFAFLALKNGNITGGTIAEGTATALTIPTPFAGGDTTVNGFFTLTAVSDDVLTVSEVVGTDANAGAAPVTIKGSHLRNPGTISEITKQSYTIETSFTDIDKHFVRKGMRVGSFGMSVTAGEIVNGNFSFMGKDTVANLASTLDAGGTYTVLAAPGTEVFNATDNVGTVSKNGTALTTAIQSIEMNGEASLREQRAVGEKFPAGIGYGRFTLSGSLVAYFETLDFYNDFLNHETVSLAFDFEDVDNNYYIFRIPSAKITADPIAPGGIDQDVMEEMEWSAKRDVTLSTQFMIDRYSSIKVTSA